jgi:predicted DNA-binding protein (MmcQ/YjbR family)
MDIEEIQDYCLSKPFTEVGSPFGPETLVFKVHGKMFALVPVDEEHISINLKNNPEKNIELIEEFDGIIPGWHMNKVHWITVKLNFGLKKLLILQLIDESYQIVFDALPKKLREIS